MKKLLPYLFCVVFVVFYTFGYDLLKAEKAPKQGYFLTQLVFQDFKGTKEMTAKLNKQQQEQKRLLDSLLANITVLESTQNARAVQKAKESYQKLYQQFATNNQQTMERYNSQIWTQINQYVNEFGKEQDYQFLFGANGSGVIMFADSSLNITKDVLVYINNKYNGK